MPHQCTDCRRVFDDGSKEMLSGCPDCGGNKFQFHPGGVDENENADPEPAAEPPDPPEPPVDSSVARTVGNAATAVRDFVGSSPSPPEPPAADESDPVPASQPAESPPSPEPADSSITANTAETEDSAQASARSDVVSPDELPSTADHTGASRPTPVLDDSTDEAAETQPPDESDEERPDLSELRAELNDQFESIKVLEPGQYELNLMELYDREEYIIALQEDGKYTIQVPERWEEA